MAVSTIGVADAASPDVYLHTHQRTISAVARDDQYVQMGESAYPTYSASATNVSIATSNDHVLQVMGDGSSYSRIKRIVISSTIDGPAANSSMTLHLYRLSSAGTGGSAVTPAPYDAADTYAGGAMTLPTSKGTEGTLLWPITVSLWATGIGASQYIWTPTPGMKPIIFGPATSNGVAFKVTNGVASATAHITVEFITTSYL